MKIRLTNVANRRRAYNGAVFEAENKIPVFLVTQGQEADLERR
jgi:hypothetical protein